MTDIRYNPYHIRHIQNHNRFKAISQSLKCCFHFSFSFSALIACRLSFKLNTFWRSTKQFDYDKEKKEKTTKTEKEWTTKQKKKSLTI